MSTFTDHDENVYEIEIEDGEVLLWKRRSPFDRSLTTIPVETARELAHAILAATDPDVEAMITRPAATVACSVNLLDATMAALHRPAPLLKPTCDEAGNWRYVPAVEIDGPRVPATAIAALSLDQLLYAAVASALDIPADPARAAVEGQPMSEVA